MKQAEAKSSSWVKMLWQPGTGSSASDNKDDEKKDVLVDGKSDNEDGEEKSEGEERARAFHAPRQI